MKIWPFDVAARETGGRYITSAQLKTCLKPFESIRKAVGDRMDIMVEFHSLWNLPTARTIARELEAYKPLWFEDPIVMNSPQALAEYARTTNVWVCASETLGSRWPYKEYLDRDAVHVVMVDLSWAGGLTEGRKIACMAATYHRPFAAHDCIGPISYAAAIAATDHAPPGESGRQATPGQRSLSRLTGLSRSGRCACCGHSVGLNLISTRAAVWRGREPTNTRLVRRHSRRRSRQGDACIGSMRRPHQINASPGSLARAAPGQAAHWSRRRRR
jgi:hypothetical protein